MAWCVGPDWRSSDLNGFGPDGRRAKRSLPDCGSALLPLETAFANACVGEFEAQTRAIPHGTRFIKKYYESVA